MERYGTADLIHDILERQGLIWLLGNLAQADNRNANAQKVSGAEAGCNDGKSNNIPEVDVDTQCVITENGADHVYLIDSGPNTATGTFACDDEITYPLPFLWLRELAVRQRMAQQYAAQQRVPRIPVTKFTKDPYGLFNCGQSHVGNTPKTTQVNGWTYVVAPPNPPRAPIPTSTFKSYLAPLTRFNPARNQTDGSCYDVEACQPACLETYSKSLQSIKKESKSVSSYGENMSKSREVSRTVLQAAVTKLLSGLEVKEKQEKRGFSGCQQIQHFPASQTLKQQHIASSAHPSPKHIYDVPDDESISSYRTELNRIISRASRKKAKIHRQSIEDKSCQHKPVEGSTLPMLQAPSPEQCVVEARLSIHLGSKGTEKARKDRKNKKVGYRMAGKQNISRTRNLGYKTQDSSDCCASDDYVRVKYRLVSMFDDDDDDDAAAAAAATIATVPIAAGEDCVK